MFGNKLYDCATKILVVEIYILLPKFHLVANDSIGKKFGLPPIFFASGAFFADSDEIYHLFLFMREAKTFECIYKDSELRVQTILLLKY